MSVRLAINPITWSNDDLPELGGDTPLEVCLAETKQAGYAGIEKGGKFPDTSKELMPIMKKHGLELTSGWYSGHLLDVGVDREFDAIGSHLQLLKDMGSTHVIYAETTGTIQAKIDTPLSRRPKLAAGDWKGYGQKLTALAEKFADFGVPMAFHHHMGTVVEAEDEIEKLMAQSGPAVGLLYDTGHALYGGADPLRVIKQHVGRVVHVHCKDVRRDVLARARKSDMSFLNAVLEGIFTVPGDGCINYPPILKVLADHGYSGWLVVEAEQDPKKAHPMTYAKMGHDNLKRMATEAGLKVVN